MIGFRRFRVALLLALGLSVLTSTAAWSYRSIAQDQIVPDADGDYDSVTGGGGTRPDQRVHGESGQVGTKPAISTPPESGGVEPSMPTLIEILKCLWLATWETGIFP